MTEEVLEFIKSCMRNHKIRWSYHVNMRVKGRFISRENILSSIDSFEIIEEYPKDKYSPSYLIYAEHESEVIHILIATDFFDDNVIIITAYKPSIDKWESDLKTRRKI